MSLVLQSIPGFSEIPDDSFAAGSAASDTDLKALNASAKFAAVRNEQFWGFYRNGETVVLPVSPADGYAYARNELLYSWSWWWTGSAKASLNGTQDAPEKGATTGQGTLLQLWAEVSQESGLVSTAVSYYKNQQMDVSDGILQVLVHAQRMR